jgi:hypothetical protein
MTCRTSAPKRYVRTVSEAHFEVSAWLWLAFRGSPSDLPWCRCVIHEQGDHSGEGPQSRFQPAADMRLASRAELGSPSSAVRPLRLGGGALADYFTGHEGGPHGAFIERWTGRRWRVAAAPIPRGAILWSVSASGTRDVWAVGQTDEGGQLIEHWDGVRWRVLPAPRPPAPILFAVAARTPRDAWAVGVRNRGGGGKTLIEHWDGTRWAVVPSPTPPAAPGRRPYAVLRAVTAISLSDVWAAGYSGAVRSPVTRTLVEHWDGRRWTIVPSPNLRSPGGVINDLLFSISGSRRDNVWAVGSWGGEPGGYGGRGDHALALHWDGRSWSRIATPAIARRSLLFGVAARGGRAWAVGDRGLQPHQQTLIERWDGVRWSVVPSPAGFSFAAVTMSSAGAAWAVGEKGRQSLAARCS